MPLEWLLVCKKYKVYLKMPEINKWELDLWKIYKFMNNYYGESLYFVSNKYVEYQNTIDSSEYKNYETELCNLNTYDEDDMDYIDIIQHSLLSGVWNLSQLIQKEKDRRYHEMLKQEVHKV